MKIRNNLLLLSICWLPLQAMQLATPPQEPQQKVAKQQVNNNDIYICPCCAGSLAEELEALEACNSRIEDPKVCCCSCCQETAICCLLTGMKGLKTLWDSLADYIKEEIASYGKSTSKPSLTDLRLDDEEEPASPEPKDA